MVGAEVAIHRKGKRDHLLPQGKERVEDGKHLAMEMGGRPGCNNKLWGTVARGKRNFLTEKIE